MLKSIIYKEWLKTRNIVFAGFTVSFIIYTIWFIDLYSLWLAEQSVMLNLRIVNMGWVFHDILKYPALITPALLALFQFIPEVKNKRYKLQYMLPQTDSIITLYPLAFGFCLILIFDALFAISYAILSSIILPDFIVIEGFQHLLSWIIGSFVVYFFTVTVVVDPKWVRKIAVGLTGLCYIAITYSPTLFNTTRALNWQVLIIAIISVAIPWYSFYNLRKAQ